MAVLSDRKIVKLIQRLVPWDVRLLERKWSERCEYNAEGKLTSLDLEGLNFVSLPSEVGQLTSLERLQVGSTGAFSGVKFTSLKYLPPEIGHISSLRHLKLWGTELASLPPEIGNLSRLESLSIQSSCLANLPLEIENLSHLQELTVYSPAMTHFPITIFRLSRLKKLFIQGLYTNLPSEIGNLSNLQHLRISDCPLTSLPSEIGNLSNLQHLEIFKCNLTSLPPEIDHLSHLQHLYIWKCPLTSLPPEIGNLSSLQTLDLPECQLTSLPPEIGQLSNLESLGMRSNLLRRLPLEIGHLSNLQHLEVGWTPLETPPPEIVSGGLSTIRAYLQDLQTAMVERYEGKLIIVGEARMGKSSLVQALQGKPFDPVQPLTHGIEVEMITLAHPTLTDKQITLHVWDFGGQQIYHATHQFFLTHRSVYVLVWNAGVNEDAARLRFWLETITTLAPDARILLVATHHDQWHPALDIRNYQQDYLQIVAMYEVSNKDGTGLEQLKHAIALAAAETELVRMRWPKAWAEVEQQIRTLPDYHISITTFLDICREYGIDEKTAREVQGPFFHDLGIVLYFSTDPFLSSFLILKPNWITKTISRVLEDKAISQTGGILSTNDLPRIWNTNEQGQRYDAQLYPLFLRLMEQFDLCYPLDADQPGRSVRHYLFPLLPQAPLDSLSPYLTGSSSNQLVTLRYRLPFVPAGVMSWIIVRTYRYSQLLHWRTGTQLAYAGQQAQIELDTQRREIQLTVWGSFPYTFFEILKNTLDLVLDRFPGLQILREIGCNCSEQRHSHFYSYDSLIKQLATTQHAEVFCPESKRCIPVETLLYGIHPNTTAFTSPFLERQLQEIKQNLVPANELRGRFDQLNEQLKWLWYGHLRTWNLEQQKLKAPCPSLFVLRQDPGMPFNPKDWVSRSYRMQLLCQYPGGPHIMQGEEGYELREGKAWWKTMSPWLRHLVEVLKVGVPMSKALGEVFDKVDIDRFASDIDLLNEVLTDLPAIREMEAIEEAGPNAQTLRQQRLEGAAFQALYSFLDKQKRPWQGLSQVLTSDGTILWLCDHHRKEYEFPPTVI